MTSSPQHSCLLPPSPPSPPSPPFRIAAGETEAPDLKLRNGEDVSLVQDLITLPHLHEPAILHSLQERFEEGAIYTFTGREGRREGGKEGRKKERGGKKMSEGNDKPMTLSLGRSSLMAFVLIPPSSFHPSPPPSLPPFPGPILLAVNPFKRLQGVYTEDVLLTYYEQV